MAALESLAHTFRMIRVEELGQGRDGTRWRRSRRFPLMKAGISPFPGEVYHGLGAQKNCPGFMYVEYEGHARSVPVHLVERAEENGP